MQSTPFRDFIVGLFVLGGLLAVGYLSFSLGGGAYGGGGMELIAKTQAIGSLSERSPVTISGVRIGQVKAIRLNPNDYDAELTLEVDPSYELPIDTTASIVPSGSWVCLSVSTCTAASSENTATKSSTRDLTSRFLSETSAWKEPGSISFA